MDNVNVSVMDEFVETMRKAFSLANHIEGIKTIEWDMHYFGTTDATLEIAERIKEAMEEAGMFVRKEETGNRYLRGLRG